MPKANIKAFGVFFKERRIALGYTLRRFCEEKGLDPGNLSRMERGVIPPPQKKERLEEYARHLKLKEGSDEWYQFFDLASVAGGRIPDDVLNDADLIEKLPVFFRTLRGQKLTVKQLDALIEKIRKA